MPMRRFRRGDQFTSRPEGSVVLSIGAMVLMIICLVVVIVLWDTQNDAAAAPKSEADDRQQLPTVMKQIASRYNHISPAQLKQVTHTMKVVPERGGHKIGESEGVDDTEQSVCPYNEEDEGEDANCTISGTVCDCTSLRLTKVPSRLAERVQCTSLLLGDNCLREIHAYSFSDFQDLEILDLRDNQIHSLNITSFQGLPKLQSLILRHNVLPMDTSFPPGIFQNLSSLLSLDISGNDEDLINPDYPGQALSDLVNLQELAIDGLYNQGFPSDFAAMPSLYTLNLGGPYTDFCYLGTTDTYTFQYFQHLETLNISNCRLKTFIIYNSALFGVENLKTFDISWNYEFEIDGVFGLLRFFPDTLEYLYANYITPFYDPGTSITTIRAGWLPRGLRYAEARGNRFETVEAGVFEALPENLTYLDVSDNRFVFGAYLANISLMANLEILLLNGADVVYNIPKKYPSSNASVFSAASSGSFGKTSNTFFFQLPPKLIRLNMIKAGLSYRLTQISVNPNNSLEELNLDHNVFSQLTGPLYGLDRLTSLSMTGCSIETIEETFFKKLTSLERLDLSDNRIGLYLPAHKNVSLFEDLVHLKYLNLSFNSIPDQESSQDFFKGLDSLEELYMQNNRMWTFEMDISNLHELRVLNLRSNFLSSLSSNITSFIHGLVRKPNTTIEVDLSGNAIKCDCGNLDFLKWLSSSKATNESFFRNIYICAFPDDDVFSFVKDRYVSVILFLSRECTSKYALFLFSLSGTLILVSVVLVLILYRFRWNLRYLYYAAYLSFKKGVRPVVTEEDYTYDVFVSYAWPDEQFILDTLCPALESRGLKLHVHGRDFLVGDYIASNIVTAVKESRRTLVVLTRALLDSTWCNYEIQMANMESVHTGRPVLIFLIKESVSNRQLGQNLLSHIRNNTYIPYPESEPAQEPGNHLLEAFWDKLATDLKS